MIVRGRRSATVGHYGSVRQRVRRLRHRNEEGMTLIEVIVTLALTAIVMAMATYIVINVLNETTGEAASIQGVQEAQLAERSFTQYLRSAVSLLSIQTNDITFTAYSGVTDTTVSSTTIPIPQLQTIEAQLCPTKSPYVDSLEVIYGLPPAPAAGWNGLHECISPNSPTTTTLAVPSGARSSRHSISPAGGGYGHLHLLPVLRRSIHPVRIDGCGFSRSGGGGGDRNQSHVSPASGKRDQDIPYRVRHDSADGDLSPELQLGNHHHDDDLRVLRER